MNQFRKMATMTFRHFSGATIDATPKRLVKRFKTCLRATNRFFRFPPCYQSASLRSDSGNWQILNIDSLMTSDNLNIDLSGKLECNFVIFQELLTVISSLLDTTPTSCRLHIWCNLFEQCMFVNLLCVVHFRLATKRDYRRKWLYGFVYGWEVYGRGT